MAKIPKKHHLIPRTYLQDWCYKGETVHTYDRNKDLYEDRNIYSILYKKDFNSIKAGSIYTTNDAMYNIF